MLGILRIRGCVGWIEGGALLTRSGREPDKKDAYAQYAQNWGQAILCCDADRVGYFAPHEGSSALAYGGSTM